MVNGPGRAGGRRSPPFFHLVMVALAAAGALFAVPAFAQGAAPPPNSAAVRDHVREILSRPEFQPEPQDTPLARMGRAVKARMLSTQRWLDRTWHRIEKWFNRLFAGAGPSAGAAARIVSQVFGICFLLLGVSLVAYLARGILYQKWTARAKARTAFDESETDEGIVTEPDVWIRQAGEFAGSADYRRAFRAVFVAIILLFDQSGLIEFERSRTNGDYLLILRRMADRRLVDLFASLTRDFDRKWYGHEKTGDDDYRRILDSYARVQRILTEPPAAALTAGKA